MTQPHAKASFLTLFFVRTANYDSLQTNPCRIIISQNLLITWTFKAIITFEGWYKDCWTVFVRARSSSFKLTSGSKHSLWRVDFRQILPKKPPAKIESQDQLGDNAARNQYQGRQKLALCPCGKWLQRQSFIPRFQTAPSSNFLIKGSIILSYTLEI